MAPRFTDDVIAALKRTLLSRAPGYNLTPDDVKHLVAATGLTPHQIQEWEYNTCRNYQGDARTTFLQSDKDVVSAPVKLPVFGWAKTYTIFRFLAALSRASLSLGSTQTTMPTGASRSSRGSLTALACGR